MLNQCLLCIFSVLFICTHASAQMTHQAAEIEAGTIGGTLTVEEPVGYSVGRVGIGDSTPSTALDVNGDVHVPSGRSYRIGSLNDRSYRLRLHLSSSTKDAYIDYYDDLHFRSGSSSSSDRVIFKSNGRVGIGEFNPSAKLEVSGDILADIISITSTANINEICDEAGQNCKDVSGGWSTGATQTLSVSDGTITLSDGGGSVDCEEITGDAGLCDSVDDVGVGSCTDVNDCDITAEDVSCTGCVDATDVSASIGTCSNICTDADSNAKTLCADNEFLAGDTTTDCWTATEIVTAGGGSGGGSSFWESSIYGIKYASGNVGVERDPRNNIEFDVSGDIRATGTICDTNGCIGSGSGDGHSLDASDGSPANAVYVDSAGDVGIGTTSATAALHIRDTSIDGTPGVSGVQIAGGGSYAAIELTGTSGGYIDFNNEPDSSDYDARIIVWDGYEDRLDIDGAGLAASSYCDENGMGCVDASTLRRRAKCPLYTADRNLHRYGHWSWRSGNTLIQLYDGFVNTYGVNVEENTANNDEWLVWDYCTENSDGTVTFNNPRLVDGNDNRCFHPGNPGSSNYRNGFFLASNKAGECTIGSHSRFRPLSTNTRSMFCYELGFTGGASSYTSTSHNTWYYATYSTTNGYTDGYWVRSGNGNKGSKSGMIRTVTCKAPSVDCSLTRPPTCIIPGDFYLS